MGLLRIIVVGKTYATTYEVMEFVRSFTRTTFRCSWYCVVPMNQSCCRQSDVLSSGSLFLAWFCGTLQHHRGNIPRGSSIKVCSWHVSCFEKVLERDKMCRNECLCKQQRLRSGGDQAPHGLARLVGRGRFVPPVVYLVILYFLGTFP